ncbi:Ycf66 family protein [Egbenema bharatensis]|uniref:Ycf66 family protein n=1 Tax=Egbenema bharatensis TaxID=3463334 RepID=UPI003A8760A8
MLTYLLAIVVALASFALYMSAFFLPELYRKYDLIWSGVGVFYAYEVWHNAAQIRGAVLLGQIAVSFLLGWFAWQTFSMRWEQTPIDQRTQVPQVEGSLGEVVQYQSARLWDYLQSDEFRSRLPQNLDQIPQKASKLLEQSKQWITSTLTNLQSSTKPPDSPPPNSTDRLHPPPSNPPSD